MAAEVADQDYGPAAAFLMSEFGHVPDAPRRVQALCERARLRINAGTRWERGPLAPADLLELHRICRRAIEGSAPPVENSPGPEVRAERLLGALEVLVQDLHTPAELRRLINRGLHYDVGLAATAALITFGAGFLIAGTLMTSVPEWEDERIYWALGNVAIGVGGEFMGAVVREGKLGAPYNRAMATVQGEGELVSRFVALESQLSGIAAKASGTIAFGVLYAIHALAGGALGPKAARLGWGALAASLAGAGPVHLQRALASHVDPVWIDGRDQETMRRSIRQLEASRHGMDDYLRRLWTGIRGAWGMPSRQAIVGAAARALAATGIRSTAVLAHALGQDPGSTPVALLDALALSFWGWANWIASNRPNCCRRARPAESVRMEEIVPPPPPAPALSAPASPVASQKIRVQPTSARSVSRHPSDLV